MIFKTVICCSLKLMLPLYKCAVRVFLKYEPGSDTQFMHNYVKYVFVCKS